MDTIEIAVGSVVISGLLQNAPAARACYVFAHGAGAGMTHPFMATVSAGLLERGISTLRYQFPYMEKRSRRPIPPRLLMRPFEPPLPKPRVDVLIFRSFAGGKSFGSRMTSQAQAQSPLPMVRGLVFLGFPLHPAGKPSDNRAKHLFDIYIPMLFLQGDKDKLASSHCWSGWLVRSKAGPRCAFLRALTIRFMCQFDPAEVIAKSCVRCWTPLSRGSNGRSKVRCARRAIYRLCCKLPPCLNTPKQYGKL